MNSLLKPSAALDVSLGKPTEGFRMSRPDEVRHESIRTEHCILYVSVYNK